MDEPGSLLVRRRRERDRERVRLSSTPAGAARDELGPGHADDEERNLDRPVDEVIDEVEQAVVGPVEILEDQHERPALRECFEEAPPGGEGLRLAFAFQVRLAGDPDQRPQVRLDPAQLVRLFEDVFGRGPELRAGLLRRVGLKDSRLPFTISANAQNAIPSPYGSDRPCRHVISSRSTSTIRKSSRTRRHLPIPGTPTSVTS